jgi:peptidoglycan/xylan/chitin deacetylase (PgdA/CDA1 family)
VALNKDKLLILAMMLAGLAFWFVSQRPLFPELQGPAAVTRLPQPGDFTLDMDSFPQHGSNALALWINDPASSWYGLASGLSSMGIPFRIVTDPAEALHHKVIMVYPSLSGANTSPAALQGFAAHVRAGGTLLAFSVLGGGLEEVFGFGSAVESPLHHTLDFARTEFSRDFVQSPAESHIYLESLRTPELGIPGIDYLDPKHPPVAVYEHGTAAITMNLFESAEGVGHAYAVGIDIGHFILRAHNGRYFNAADTYVNAYQPKVDTLLRFIAQVYREGESNALLLSPTPAGKEVTILMTHDIDFTPSIVNAPVYAEVEQAAGVPATYFIQTKYVRDYSDDYFLDAERSMYLRTLAAMGMEIASHSVAHSRVFDTLEAGSGAERYPEYRPFVQQVLQVRGASIGGELRVSKFLLEELSGTPVTAFRPGHLAHPDSLPQMLHATGYLYSSSMTANEALTHLPYRAMYDRGYALPTPIWEFPVTIEDEEGILGDRINAAIELTRNIARYRGLVNVLVHTDSTDHKLDFTREYIAAFRDTAWFGTVSGFGQWWEARDSVAIAVTAATDDQPATVRVSVDGSIDGLTLELPEGWTYLNLNGPAGSRQQGRLMSLGEFSGETVLQFQTTREEARLAE